jgi:ketosteroid isomerase-like protein
MRTWHRNRCWSKALRVAFLVVAGTGIIFGAGGTPTQAQKDDLLKTREAVWRSWFAGDQARLRELVPEDVLAINNGEEAWQHLDAILSGARDFVARGRHLVRLEFPRTEIQVYGDVAILYSLYSFETDGEGGRQTASGRATEIFVRRGDRWVNPGWHMDSGR